jgi:hypothetical protein
MCTLCGGPRKICYDHHYKVEPAAIKPQSRMSAFSDDKSCVLADDRLDRTYAGRLPALLPLVGRNGLGFDIGHTLAVQLEQARAHDLAQAASDTPGPIYNHNHAFVRTKRLRAATSRPAGGD